MIQGTTPTISLTLPLDVSHVKEAEFTLGDGTTIVRTWKLVEMMAEGNTLKIVLTEEDTLAMEPKVYYGQLRVRMDNGNITATDVMPFYMKDLKSEAKL